MCLAIYQPLGDSPISDEQLLNGWNANPHGAGFMFAADGKLIIRKAFYKLADLRKAYVADHQAYGQSSPFVLHFRWATHGNRSAGNVHPHALANGDVGLVHNGVLYDFDFGHRDDSDTVTFCKTILACRSAENLMSEELNIRLAEIIEWGNKLVLMDGRGNVSIVNAIEGVWEGDRWYSNTDYLPPKPKEKHVWSPLNVGPIERGTSFSGSATNAAIADRFASLSLYDDDPTFEDELDRIDLEMADAYLVGDDHRIEELELEKRELENERDEWAGAELAMARDGY